MAKITEAINMSFRVDRDLKKQADKLFKELGLNTSVALNMFLAQCVRNQALPFTPSRVEKNINSQNLNEPEIMSREKNSSDYNDFENIL